MAQCQALVALSTLDGDDGTCLSRALAIAPSPSASQLGAHVESALRSLVSGDYALASEHLRVSLGVAAQLPTARHELDVRLVKALAHWMVDEVPDAIEEISIANQLGMLLARYY